MTRISPSRRLFMQLAAGTAAAPFIAGSAFAQAAQFDRLPVRAIGRPMPGRVNLPDSPPPPPSEGSVGIALVGLGNYAINIIAPAFASSSRCHLAGLVSGNRQKAEQIASAYGLPEDTIYSYDDFDRIAQDDRIDAIYIVLPSGLHADWTEKAFAAGKHVLCEKPMALTSDECQRMIDAGKVANRKLMIGYRCHFEPYNLRAMELMREKAAGDIRVIRTDHHYLAGRNSTPANNWRFHRGLAGGGPLEDYGIYGLQAALYLTGEMPSSISAQNFSPEGHPAFTEINAVTSSQLFFPSGAMAQLSTSYNAAGENRVEVRGVEDVLFMENATSYGGQRMTLGSTTIEPGDPSVQFGGMLDHFGEAVRDDTLIKVGGDMGLRDVRLMEAIYAAASEGRTIALNPDGTMAG